MNNISLSSIKNYLDFEFTYNSLIQQKDKILKIDKGTDFRLVNLYSKDKSIIQNPFSRCDLLGQIAFNFPIRQFILQIFFCLL
jgi:hypothetical protein